MYESFYGFTSKPFQLNPDPSFYYGSRGHRRAMAYLEYGLHQSEGFIVITGDVGAGKTTLVRSLLQRLDSSKVVAAHLVSTQIDADDILRLVAAAFGLPAKNVEKADLLLQLETFLVKLTAAGKRALLIVDEAQNLTPRAVEELRMLSNFQLEDHALLQSFLVGQPEFRQTMQSEHMQQLRQRVIASYHLGPLDLAETRAYVEHRLGCVGWKGDPRIEVSAFDVIHAASGGIPRRINTLCDRVLLAGFLSEKHGLTASDVDNVVTEMREESGPERSVTPINAMPGLDSSALARLMADPAAARRLAEVAAGYQASRLEARVEQLEKVICALLGLSANTTDGADQDKERRHAG
ncbi:XrtA/PEP-CTERM system-associated ATPase [Niveibacterium sp. COAC-50]|uniref:XrtA/PEP-CTERM system-associated ATPase n=1 Tax=Niveibacterium sp. COAC-50 TaxID=2729384 RepID=UPI001554812C|nr:XrtA/PEP-CTERM system-associated ATPase [Niveibacterium sp. COAC-50]